MHATRTPRSIRHGDQFLHVLASVIGLSDEEKMSSTSPRHLHDIGKVGIPDSILLKPDMLSGEELTISRGTRISAA